MLSTHNKGTNNKKQWQQKKRELNENVIYNHHFHRLVDKRYLKCQTSL